MVLVKGPQQATAVIAQWVRFATGTIEKVTLGGWREHAVIKLEEGLTPVGDPAALLSLETRSVLEHAVAAGEEERR